MNCVYLKSGFSNRIEALFNEMVRRNNTYKLAEKENRRSEVYSPQYYVITGIQSIYADLAEDTKDKFNTLLEKAELHFHIRFILCSTTKELAEFAGTNWYKRHVTGSDGIWVGNGISDQYILKLGRLTNALYSEILPPFGYTVKRGKATLVKLIVGEHSEEDAE